MCVVAAYIGSRKAAPTLIEMLRREQGMGGGFYTGIATIHEGRLHYAKALGDLDTLLAETSAAQLPGTIGIAHGRSKSGGAREWSHPFVDDDSRLAYVANGMVGFFEGKTDRTAAPNAALARGERFRTAQADAIGSYPVLSDGSCIHMSEAMAHDISHRLTEANDLAEAMAGAFCATPAELVGLSIHLQSPTRIAACRINMPLTFGRDETGMYAATTALAFPESVSWTIPMAPNASAMVAADGVEIRPMAAPPAAVAPMLSADALSECVVSALRTGEPQTIAGLCKVTEQHWAAGCLDQPAMAVFETLTALSNEGKVRFDEVRVPGQYDRGTAPLTHIRWVD